MDYVKPRGADQAAPCLRSYGRAEVELQTSLETPHGRVRCLVLDLSLGGARLVTDQAIEPGEAVWLSLHKMRVFGTVQWAQGNKIGVQFEQKLPKAMVLSLRGYRVHPQVLEEVETKLVARDWVVGTPTGGSGMPPVAERLAMRNQGLNASLRAGIKAEQRFDRQVLMLISGAALAGSLIGIASVMLQ